MQEKNMINIKAICRKGIELEENSVSLSLNA